MVARDMVARDMVARDMVPRVMVYMAALLGDHVEGALGGAVHCVLPKGRLGGVWWYWQEPRQGTLRMGPLDL